jgi:hypothetical protein
MFHALGWLLILSLLALWSLAAWAFHSIAVWTISQAGVLAGDPGVMPSLRLPDWLAPWIPPELMLALESMVAAFKPAIGALLEWVPALEGGLSLAVWMVWGLGSVLLIVLGLLASALIAALGRGASAPGGPSGSAAAAR